MKTRKTSETREDEKHLVGGVLGRQSAKSSKCLKRSERLGTGMNTRETREGSMNARETREKGKEECVLALLLASVEKIGTGNLVQVPPLPCIGN